MGSDISVSGETPFILDCFYRQSHSAGNFLPAVCHCAVASYRCICPLTSSLTFSSKFLNDQCCCTLFFFFEFLATTLFFVDVSNGVTSDSTLHPPPPHFRWCFSVPAGAQIRKLRGNPLTDETISGYGRKGPYPFLP